MRHARNKKNQRLTIILFSLLALNSTWFLDSFNSPTTSRDLASRTDRTGSGRIAKNSCSDLDDIISSTKDGSGSGSIQCMDTSRSFKDEDNKRQKVDIDADIEVNARRVTEKVELTDPDDLSIAVKDRKYETREVVYLDVSVSLDPDTEADCDECISRTVDVNEYRIDKFSSIKKLRRAILKDAVNKFGDEADAMIDEIEDEIADRKKEEKRERLEARRDAKEKACLIQFDTPPEKINDEDYKLDKVERLECLQDNSMDPTLSYAEKQKLYQESIHPLMRNLLVNGNEDEREAAQTSLNLIKGGSGDLIRFPSVYASINRLESGLATEKQLDTLYLQAQSGNQYSQFALDNLIQNVKLQFDPQYAVNSYDQEDRSFWYDRLTQRMNSDNLTTDKVVQRFLDKEFVYDPYSRLTRLEEDSRSSFTNVREVKDFYRERLNGAGYTPRTSGGRSGDVESSRVDNTPNRDTGRRGRRVGRG